MNIITLQSAQYLRDSLHAASQYKLSDEVQDNFPNVIDAALPCFVHFDQQPQLFLQHSALQITTTSVKDLLYYR